MGIADWKVGQEVIVYDSGRSHPDIKNKTTVTKLGRKLVTTADGHKFDADESPPRQRNGYGSDPVLYSLETWAERTWRSNVRSEVLRLFERGYDAETVPLETMMSLSEVLLLGVPEHLKPKQEERLDEIRSVDSNDDHHRAGRSK